VRQAIKNGCKELWVTSQDNGCYGRDIGANLPQLLNEIVKIKEKFFVRVGMMNPLHVKPILDDLINAYKNQKIFKFLHLPVESGSDKILKDMRRGYRVKDFKEIVEKFRRELIQLTLSTDIIVGYPTEKEADFQKTLNLIKEIKPDIVNISKFGPRTKTEAAKLKQLSPKIVKERSKKLFEIVRGISMKNNKKWLGWEGEVLVDEIGKENSYMARNFAYKPIVIKNKEEILGNFVKVKIIETKSNYLVGEM
jgi:MiaB-like tRNA modifying enzyme